MLWDVIHEKPKFCSIFGPFRVLAGRDTDKKDSKIFLMDKEIKRDRLQSHTYMTNGLFIYGEKFAHFLI